MEADALIASNDGLEEITVVLEVDGEVDEKESKVVFQIETGSGDNGDKDNELDE